MQSVRLVYCCMVNKLSNVGTNVRLVKYPSDHVSAFAIVIWKSVFFARTCVWEIGQ